jgi:hypothetical protein
MPEPPLSDHENEGSDTEQEPELDPIRRRTPRQRPRSETPPRRRARERDPEDFNFMPRHANPGGNRNVPGQEEPNVDNNNENADPVPPDAPQNQGDAGQQQANAGQ